jgi:hypothetical protein
VTDLTPARELALNAAIILHTPIFGAQVDELGIDTANLDVRRTATSLFHWITGPAYLLLRAGPVRDADGNTTEPIRKGDAVQLHIADRQGRPYEVDYTVELTDSLGNPIPDDDTTTGDDLSWTFDSGEGVVTTVISADTRTCTARTAQLGSAVIRVGIVDLSATAAVDVVPGEAALIRIVEGTPRVVEG